MIKIFSAFLLSLVLLTSADAAEKTTHKLCYVSTSISDILPSISEYKKKVSGFEIAIAEFNSKVTGAEAKLLINSTLTAKNSMPELIKWAKKEKCFAVVGLISSREALQAAPLLQNAGLVGVSSTATNPALSKWHPNIWSFSTDSESLVRETVTALSLQKDTNCFIIQKKQDLYSATFTDLYNKYNLKCDHILLNDAHYIPRETELRLAKRLGESKATSIVYTTYPLLSLQSLKQLNDLVQKNLTTPLRIYGNPAWMEPHIFVQQSKSIQAILPRIQVFSPWNIVNPNVHFKKFQRKYVADYKSHPDHDTCYDYDVATVILRCAESSCLKDATASCLKKCMTELKQYTGVTGDYKFGNNKSHPQRQEFLLDYRLQWFGVQQ